MLEIATQMILHPSSFPAMDYYSCLEALMVHSRYSCDLLRKPTISLVFVFIFHNQAC